MLGPISSLRCLLGALLLSPIVSAFPLLSARNNHPSCDLSAAELPQRGSGRELRGPGYTHPNHVALGQGTQNYTCKYGSYGTPTPIGALAQLYDYSCSVTGDGTHSLPAENDHVGTHYFNADGEPFFDLRMKGGSDYAVVKVLDNVPSPDGSDENVDWLKLERPEGADGSGISLVYRADTSGGKAPATCEGMDASFEVAYAAQYWFYP